MSAHYRTNKVSPRAHNYYSLPPLPTTNGHELQKSHIFVALGLWLRLWLWVARWSGGQVSNKKRSTISHINPGGVIKS